MFIGGSLFPVPSPAIERDNDPPLGSDRPAPRATSPPAGGGAAWAWIEVRITIAIGDWVLNKKFKSRVQLLSGSEFFITTPAPTYTYYRYTQKLGLQRDFEIGPWFHLFKGRFEPNPPIPLIVSRNSPKISMFLPAVPSTLTTHLSATASLIVHLDPSKSGDMNFVPLTGLNSRLSRRISRSRSAAATARGLAGRPCGTSRATSRSAGRTRRGSCRAPLGRRAPAAGQV